MTQHFDVAIFGSGFAGSLLATLLQREGQRVVLIEQSRHPRFAIGESSTPLADFKLGEISSQYQLEPLAALTTYGRWRERHPAVGCGPKRGFSYFWHQPDRTFETDQEHSHELLVTANSSLEHADTHWLRSDVDLLFLEQALAAGVVYYDQCQLEAFKQGNRSELHLVREQTKLLIHADFCVLATGNPQIWQRGFSVATTGIVPQTRSRTVFGHFQGVRHWQDMLHANGQSTSEHPFPCDQSALHHVFDGGWMWQLRFDHEVTSVGWMLDSHRYPFQPALTAAGEWERWCERFPSIANQLQGAQIVAPENGLRQVAGLQCELRCPAGPTWALLPAAVGFADPLYSTGIAHALFCVQRLTEALKHRSQSPERSAHLNRYAKLVLSEVQMIDRLIRLSYRASGHFESYVAMTMLYFAASTTCEQRIKARTVSSNTDEFLLAEDKEFLQVVSETEQQVSQAEQTGEWSELSNHVERLVAPFNQVGLFAPEVSRMYRYTSAK